MKGLLLLSNTAATGAGHVLWPPRAEKYLVKIESLQHGDVSFRINSSLIQKMHIPG